MNITAGQILIRKKNKVKPLKVRNNAYEIIPRDWRVVGFSLDGSTEYIVTEGEIKPGAEIPEGVMQHIKDKLPKIVFK